ncbi:hypothetical protein OHA21_12260 [Actinoplanes sp. NBC_00393]|uniref:hypothetical protein n=1 Tax=Actinoplanes sp. NBC_00393 TaxID=2975953 RepID=UPI002E1C73CA
MSDLTAVTGVLDAWQKGIEQHRPDDVGALFTEDAIFQGLRPYSVGPAGVAAYYDSQPMGMTVEYRIREVRRLAEEVLLGWAEADFHFVDGRDPVQVNLTVVLTGGLISHYHASRR